MLYSNNELPSSSDMNNGYMAPGDTSKNPIFRIRHDSDNLSNSRHGSLSSFVRGQFSIDSSNKDIYIIGDFFDKNGNKQNVIKFLLSGLKLIDVFNYFSSFTGIGIRIETSNLDFIFQNNFSYEVIYHNGWYYIYTIGSTSSSNTGEQRYGFRSAALGSTAFNPQYYYDLFYTSPDFDSVIPSEFKNSIGGYVRETSVFGSGTLTENVYQDSISLKLENISLYEDIDALVAGEIVEVIITNEVMSLEFISVSVDNILSFSIMERGLYGSPVQCHIIGSHIKRTDNSNIFNFTSDKFGEYFFQYRCLALNINALEGNFICSELASIFDWESSAYSSFDYGFEIPRIEKFTTSGLIGTDSTIPTDDALIELFRSNSNDLGNFATTFINGLPVTIESSDGSIQKRLISDFKQEEQKIYLNSKLPFSISASDSISFGPSPSTISYNGISMNQGGSALFTGFLGNNKNSIEGEKNQYNDIVSLLPARRSINIRTSDTFYIWIKHIVKNNNMSSFAQRIIISLDCKVN